MMRIRPRRIPANETPAQRQAREDREAERIYGMNRRSSKYYGDLDAINSGAKPSTNDTNKTNNESTMATNSENTPARRLEDHHQEATIDWDAPGAPAVPLSSTAGAARQGGITGLDGMTRYHHNEFSKAVHSDPCGEFFLADDVERLFASIPPLTAPAPLTDAITVPEGWEPVYMAWNNKINSWVDVGRAEYEAAEPEDCRIAYQPKQGE